MRLTIYFDGQYWVGVAEDTEYEPPLVARHIFGAEPQDADIARFVNGPMFALLAETATVAPAATPAREAGPRPMNPKRRSREAAAAVRERGVSTRAQSALRQQYEARKVERKTRAQDERDAALERKWALKRARAKARHRGR